MNFTFSDKRRLLPRWRKFHKPAHFCELNYGHEKPKTKEESTDHINAIEQWRLDNTLENAIELCCSAIVQARFDDAREAAAFIIETEKRNRFVIGLAEKILNPDKIFAHETVNDPQVEISILRKRTHQSPGNAIFWIDMALAYSSLGQHEKAERAVENALILAPHNRFVVRCAARFFVHVDKIQRAHQVVKKYRFLKNDAWVLATELSISSIKEVPSKHIKLARNTIEKNRISPFHISELAGALGVVETERGSNKKALRLFTRSVEKPTENSIAQAQWSKDKYKLNIQIEQIVDFYLAYEAQMYKYHQSGDWEKSIDSAKQWAEYEPYSTRAFLWMSSISTICQNDHESSIKYNEHGLTLDKNNFAFMNNITVSYAQIGEIEKAEKQFNRIKEKTLSKRKRSIYTATKGMLAFKRGNINEGRELYDEAIATIEHIHDKNLAWLHYAKEELLAKTPIADKCLDEIKKKMKNETDKGILAFKEHVEKLK